MKSNHSFCGCEPLREKGTQLCMAGRFKEAVETWKKVLAIHPDDERAWGNMGICFSELDMKSKAIECFDKALSFNPNYVFALSNKASCLARDQRYEEALELTDKVLSLDPNYHDALVNKGVILTKQNKYKESIPILDKALAVNPNNPLALCKRGAATLELFLQKYPNTTFLEFDKKFPGDRFPLKELTDNMKYLHQAMELAPARIETWYYMGIHMYLMGHPMAVSFFERVLGADPDHEGARKYLTLAKKARG